MGVQWEVPAEDPPGVLRRRRKDGGLSECKCSKCGKWDSYGCVFGGDYDGHKEPYYFVCSTCVTGAA